MPKDTFFNLQAEKRDRIIEVIIDEFSENSYETASINQIVKNADIAKGSFYQYFEDKLDIYILAIKLCQEEKMNYINASQENKRYLDDFSLIRELYKAVIEFELDKPKMSNIMYKFHKSADLSLKTHVMKSVSFCDTDEIRNILERGVDKGKVYYNIDLDFVTFILDNMSINIREYLKIKRQENRYIDYNSFINSAVDLIENGIKLRSKKRDNNIF